jgi:RNA-binding protein YhbY
LIKIEVAKQAARKQRELLGAIEEEASEDGVQDLLLRVTRSL